MKFSIGGISDRSLIDFGVGGDDDTAEIQPSNTSRCGVRLQGALIGFNNKLGLIKMFIILRLLAYCGIFETLCSGYKAGRAVTLPLANPIAPTPRA